MYLELDTLLQWPLIGGENETLWQMVVGPQIKLFLQLALMFNGDLWLINLLLCDNRDRGCRQTNQLCALLHFTSLDKKDQASTLFLVGTTGRNSGWLLCACANGMPQSEIIVNLHVSNGQARTSLFGLHSPITIIVSSSQEKDAEESGRLNYKQTLVLHNKCNFWSIDHLIANSWFLWPPANYLHIYVFYWIDNCGYMGLLLHPS